ncbi:GntR family transcriptional regulator [Herbaspirillum lusitanum]|jgi:DNA-binding GntR family transcriptional regulator|uniref:GntR family transcriptional regulator n=1 Tax=Herbaspirillum lusitanum TaxID=213312 RepID=A0ABW9A587_9BURK
MAESAQKEIARPQKDALRTPVAREELEVQPNETLADSLQRRFERDIANGTLLPGMRLDEKEIAERFGVSRTPVREALRLLSASGLVDLRGHQGVTVRTIKVQALLEMFQVMAELEGLCARLASRRILPEQRLQLEEIHARLTLAASEGTINEFYDINKEFHEAIYSVSRNEFLAEQTRSLRNRVGAYRRQVTYMPGRIADTLREHEEVMQAIFAHDGDRAHAAMRGHISLLGDNLSDFIAHFNVVN